MQLEWLRSPLGILAILLAGGGVFLIIWNFFRPERSYRDNEAIVRQRQENLPLLRDNIDAILKRQKELAYEIGKIPLQDFFNKYLKTNKNYRASRKLLGKTYPKLETHTIHKMATLWAIGKFFYLKNICLNDACKDDEYMIQLEAKKAIYYHRNDDKSLSNTIDDLLRTAAKYHSILALAELEKNNSFPLQSVKKYAVLKEKPEVLERMATRPYKKMNNRIAFLMKGGDL